jgi:hypothetical protein
MVSADASPTCRVCGRDLVPNARGDYVACCSAYVRPPARLSPLRTALQLWTRAIERVFFAEGRWASGAARALVSMVGLALMIGLMMLAAKCSALF